MDFDAVVFDMDGVLFDSERATMGCWRTVAEAYGITQIDGVFLRCVGTTHAKNCEILRQAYGADFPAQAFVEKAQDLLCARYDRGNVPFKAGVPALLDALKAHDKRIGLATSSYRAVVERRLNAAGILNRFCAVICGDAVPNSKPAPDIYKIACERLGVEPHRAVAIEDSYNGIRSASAAGLLPVMVPDLLPPTDEMTKLSAAVLPDLLAVRSYLFRTNQK